MLYKFSTKFQQLFDFWSLLLFFFLFFLLATKYMFPPLTVRSTAYGRQVRSLLWQRPLLLICYFTHITHPNAGLKSYILLPQNILHCKFWHSSYSELGNKGCPIMSSWSSCICHTAGKKNILLLIATVDRAKVIAVWINIKEGISIIKIV